MATNLLTSVILLRISRVEEARGFLAIAEKALENAVVTEVILHNYQLAIGLLRNICQTFCDGPITEAKLNERLEPMHPDIAFLIHQHWQELLIPGHKFQTVLKETLTEAFTEMLQTSLFVPFLHQEALGHQLKRARQLFVWKKDFLPEISQVRELILLRQKTQQALEFMNRDLSEVDYQPEEAQNDSIMSNPYHSQSVGAPPMLPKYEEKRLGTSPIQGMGSLDIPSKDQIKEVSVQQEIMSTSPPSGFILV